MTKQDRKHFNEIVQANPLLISTYQIQSSRPAMGGDPLANFRPLMEVQRSLISLWMAGVLAVSNMAHDFWRGGRK